MEKDDEDRKSMLGSFLRAVSKGAWFVCFVFAAKAVFGSAAGAMDDLLTAAVTGAMGAMSMVGATAAAARCGRAGAADRWEVRRSADTLSITVPNRAAGSAGVEASEMCERRFTARLDQERGQGVGRFM